MCGIIVALCRKLCSRHPHSSVRVCSLSVRLVLYVCSTAAFLHVEGRKGEHDCDNALPSFKQLWLLKTHMQFPPYGEESKTILQAITSVLFRRFCLLRCVGLSQYVSSKVEVQFRVWLVVVLVHRIMVILLLPSADPWWQDDSILMNDFACLIMILHNPLLQMAVLVIIGSGQRNLLMYECVADLIMWRCS